MPMRASRNPSIIPAGPPPAMQQRVWIVLITQTLGCRLGRRRNSELMELSLRVSDYAGYSSVPSVSSVVEKAFTTEDTEGCGGRLFAVGYPDVLHLRGML